MFKRFSWLERVLWLVVLCAIPAAATTLSIPTSFTAGSTISSSQMNGNFNAVAAWANGNIDSTNVGSAGINPVKVLCTTTATCTFGSAQTYIFNPNSAAVVPLSLTNAGSDTADYLDITANGGGAGGVFKVDKNSNATTGGVILAAPVATPTASSVWVQNDGGATNGLSINVPASSTNGIAFKVAGVVSDSIDANGQFDLNPVTGTVTAGSVGLVNDNGATNGMILNVPTASTNGFQFQVNNSKVAQVTNAGILSALGGVEAAPTINSASAYSFLPPFYTKSGTAVAGTLHGVYLTASGTTNGSCANNTVCAMNSSQLQTFTNNAVFTTAPSCSGANTSVTASVVIQEGSTTTTETTGYYNATGGAISNSTTLSATVTCIGV